MDRRRWVRVVANTNFGMRKNSEQRSEGAQGMSRQERRGQEGPKQKAGGIQPRRTEEGMSPTQSKDRVRPRRPLLPTLAAGLLLFSSDGESPRNLSIDNPPVKERATRSEGDEQKVFEEYYQKKEKELETVIERLRGTFPSFLEKIIDKSSGDVRSMFDGIRQIFISQMQHPHRNKYTAYLAALSKYGLPASRELIIPLEETSPFYYDFHDGRDNTAASFSTLTRTFHLPRNFHGSVSELLVVLHELVHITQDNTRRVSLQTDEDAEQYTREMQTTRNAGMEWEAYAYELEAVDVLLDGRLRAMVMSGAEESDVRRLLQSVLDDSRLRETLLPFISRYFIPGSSPNNLPESFRQHVTLIMTLEKSDRSIVVPEEK